MYGKLMKQFQKNGPIIGAFLLANVLNFAFNAYLARKLSLSTYGFIALINTFWTILLVGTGALMQVTSYQVARAGKNNTNATAVYLATRSMSRRLAGVLAVGWLAASPLLVQYFHAPSLLGIMIIGPMVMLGFLTGVHRGYVQGRLHFSQVGALFLIEAGSKLVLAIVFVKLGLYNIAYLSLPLSVGIAWWASVMAARRLTSTVKLPKSQRSAFPWSFLGASLTASLAAMAFLSIDLLLAKHYLSNANAGYYAMLSLTGKMVFFLGSLLNIFMLPMVGSAEANKTNPRRVFWHIYSLTCGLVLVSFLALGPLGHLSVPILFGPKSNALLPYLVPYCSGIALFTLANVNVVYHLAKKHYIFPLLSLATAAFMAGQIMLSHGSIGAITDAVMVAGALSFVVVSAADLIMSRSPALLGFSRKSAKLSAMEDAIKPSVKKRILVLNWRDTRHSQAGGAEIYIHELARRWHAEGHDITMFCGNDGSGLRHETVDGVQVIRRGHFNLVYFWAFVYYVTRFRRRFDVVVDCHNGIPFFAPLYARIPVYCVVHHVHQDVFARYLSKPAAMLASFMEATVMPLVYRRRQFITVSKSSKMAMVEQLGIDAAKIQIIPNGVNLEQLAPGPKSAAPTVLYLGRLKAYKSVDVLIRAFREVVDDQPAAHLNIGGSGDALPQLKALVKELDLGKKVSFLGRVTEADKVRLMQEAWVFVNPSFAEGWGITTIEANACGTPVVASNVPGLRDSVNAPSAGYLVRYGDVNGFARKILLILSDGENRLSLSANATTWANKFDWQTSAAKFLKAIS